MYRCHYILHILKTIFITYLFIWLCQVCVSGTYYGMWGLVPCPGTEPRPPELGVWSLKHWTTREVTFTFFNMSNYSIFFYKKDIK